MQRYTVRDFQNDFPDDEVCIEWLKNHRWPNGIHCEQCDKVTKHYYIASRKSYSCQECGHHVHPTAGTIFHKSRTPLSLWFYAIYLMALTRGRVSAKQIERELGVTYKTAWRMAKLIREALA
ncbi:MAG: transposase [Anaerolineae bacterium]|nr:transposase [Anaerolineae bacterium]